MTHDRRFRQTANWDTADIRRNPQAAAASLSHSCWWTGLLQIDGDDSAIGIKNVTANEPHFTGHFPESPIMPGVLLIEGMAQTAGAICARLQGEGGNLVYFMTIDNARFRKPVVPGDRVEFHVVKQKQRGNIWKFHCDAKVDGALAAEADIGAMIMRKDQK